MALRHHRLMFFSSVKCRRSIAVASSGWCHKTKAAWRRGVPPPPSGLVSGPERTVDRLWREFFSDPSLWWDHRLEKGNARYPDFKHKKTKEALWLNGRLNPPWVEVELAAMAPSTVQLNPFSWNTRLARYVKARQFGKAMDLYRQMQRQGMNPDTFTFVSVLNACAGLQDLEVGKRLHAQITQNSYEMNVFVGNGLVDMYSKCGSIEDAERVFHKMPTRDVVVWNAMILGHVKCGQGLQALELSHQMQREGVEPDSVTYVGMLNACASLAALEQGRVVHAQILHSHCRSVFVDNGLIDMYGKCGSMEDAMQVFNDMPARNVVSWNTMILGHVKHGLGQKALELWQQMKQLGVTPDGVTFVAVLNACSSVVALEAGRDVHKQILQGGCEADVFVGNSLVDMYAKCGSVEDAIRMFDEMPIRNLVSWNTMLGGYALHGLAEAALEHFRCMCLEGVEMDKLTFVSLLSACSHGGLVDEGLHHFECMSSEYGISATVEHFACMVDLLGRAGRLREAEDLIKKMPSEPDVTVWMSLLGSCRVHGNVEIGEKVAQQIMDFHPGNSAGYVLLSNIYAGAGLWESSANVQQRRLERGAKKQPGCTWIEVNREVHSFTVDDKEHPQIAEIHAELKRLSRQMKEIGYMPDTRFLLHNVEDEDNAAFRLNFHSEKLAIAFGLLNTNPGTPVRIFKNLRVCGDCHTATKFISKITGRRIIVRDASRFHHFEDGLCSCKDYW